MTSENYKNKRHSKKPMKGGEILNGQSQYDYIEPIQAQHLEVRVTNNMPFEKAFKLFRSLVQKERILSSYKEKQFFEKPSDKKRRKRKEMKRKLLELDMKEARLSAIEKKGKKQNSDF